MFGNFIYFIIALLVLSFYEPPAELPLSLGQALIAFIGLIALFAVYIRSGFQRLGKRNDRESAARLDHQFTQLSTRSAILALALLAIDIWWLHLPAFLKSVHWLSMLPTINSLLFLLLFVGYLVLMWAFSYEAYKSIYQTDITRGNYVYSNLAFSIPVLIPWVLLFGITDIVQLLPFELPKRILNDPMGQIVYFLIFLVVAAIFAPLLIQRFWRCRPMEPGPDRSRIEALCRKAGVRYADIVYWPIFGGRMITAAVMGLVTRFRYILVTDALIKMLRPDELDQVIAHEIGHVKKNHLLLYLLFFIGFMLIAYTADLVSVFFLFYNGPVLQLIKFFNQNSFDLLSTVSAVVLIASIIIYFRFVFGFFMRNFERQADIYVFELFPTARPLISTFDKIVLNSGQPADKPNWHHFSIQQRVDYLWRCEQYPEWITRHNRKVKRSISIFIAAFLVLALAAFQLKKAEDGVQYWIIGNANYQKQNLQRAASAYEMSIRRYAKNPEALNNLAWLLATSGAKDLHDPHKALKYAQRAIALKKAPHIWDTLAEALFANGRIAEAVEAEKQALQMAPEDRHIYEKQLARFRDALARLQ